MGSSPTTRSATTIVVSVRGTGTPGAAPGAGSTRAIARPEIEATATSSSPRTCWVPMVSPERGSTDVIEVDLPALVAW